MAEAIDNLIMQELHEEKVLHSALIGELRKTRPQQVNFDDP